MDDAQLEQTIRSMEKTLASLRALRTRGDDPLAKEFDLVLVSDLVRRWGTSKEEVTATLRARGALQLPRTTQGGGIKALTLWALRNHEHWKAKSARARVAIYLHHHAMANPFDPLAVDPLAL